MSIFDTFAKRMARSRNSGKPILYKFDELPVPLRVQIVHILQDTIGRIPARSLYSSISEEEKMWKSMHDILAKEMGVFKLRETHEDYDLQCLNFINESQDFEQVMSMIEIAFRLIDVVLRDKFSHKEILYNEAIDELNQRLNEHAIGYQYESGYLIKVDSHYLHSETVEPAVSLLYDAGFSGALDEFMEAHKHYRQGNKKDAITNALKSFESTMKTICDKRKWQYDKKRATTAPLIDVILANGIIPQDMQSHLTGLRTTLESGVPTVRNRMGGHGQGSVPVNIPDYIVSYALHLTASNIVLLVSAYNDLK